MARQFLDIENVPDELKNKVRQDLKFRTGIFVWRIKFNIPLDPLSVTASSTFVSNEAGERLQAKIRYDAENLQIEIEPLVPYAQDEFYYLNITNRVKSRNGQRLPKSYQFKFKL